MAPPKEGLSIPQRLDSTTLIEARKRWAEKDVAAKCLQLALEKWEKEPECIQNNAHLTIQSQRGVMEFISGNGENKMTVWEQDGRPCYHLQVHAWAPWLVKQLNKVMQLIIDWYRWAKRHFSCLQREGYRSIVPM